MPDWLTHLVLGLVLTELFSVQKKSLVLLGAILPDILSKLVLLQFFVPILDLNLKFLRAFHVPFVLFLLTLIAAPVFKYDYRKVIFWLNLGILSHFLSDLMLRHLSPTSGMMLFYPFSSAGFSLNLVWPDQSYFILIPALLLYFAIILIKRYYHQINISRNRPASHGKNSIY